jgi:hypothetical protein
MAPADAGETEAPVHTNERDPRRLRNSRISIVKSRRSQRGDSFGAGQYLRCVPRWGKPVCEERFTCHILS